MRAVLIVHLLILPVLLLAALIVGGASDSAKADATNPVVGIDMSPDGSNTGMTLGTTETCISVANVAGTTFNIDAWLDAVPTGRELAGFNYPLNFPSTAVEVIGRSHLPPTGMMGDTDLSTQASAGTPVTTSPFNAAVLDLGGSMSAPAGTVGVLGRYTLRVTASAASGFYTFSFDTTPGLFTFADVAGGEWDSSITSVQGGTLALGQDCSLSAAADVAVSKADLADPTTAGSALTYTLTVSNVGPSAATGVTVTDVLPESYPFGVAFVSATPSQGSCSETLGIVTCALGGLADGASATIDIVITPPLSGTLFNTATVIANELDLNLVNNVDTETTTVELAPPANDNFENATVVGALPFTATQSSAGATGELDEPYCGGFSATVWYSYTPVVDGTLEASTTGSNFTVGLGVYTGTSLSDLTNVACTTFTPSLTFPAHAGETIYFQAGGRFAETGTLRLNLQELILPPNDNFENATMVDALPFSATQNNNNATTQSGEPEPCSTGATVWFKYTPPQDMQLRAKLNSPFFRTLAVFRGSALSNLTDITCYGSITGPVQLTFLAHKDETIYFQAGGNVSSTGELVFDLLEFVSPPNDNFANATVITTLPFTATQNSDGATTQSGEPQPCSTGATVWFKYTPAENRELRVTMNAQFYSTLTVFRGSALSNLTYVTCSIAYFSPIQLNFLAHRNETIYFQVGGFSSYGNFVFDLIEFIPPPNDDFANATVVPGLPYTAAQNTGTALVESDEPPICAFTQRTVWYSFTPAIDMLVQADTFGSNYDTVLAAYTGSDIQSLLPVGCNDNTSGVQSRIGLNMLGGITYHFKIGGYSGQGGNLVFNMTELERPSCPSTPDFQYIAPDAVGDAFFGFGIGPVKHDITSVTGSGDATTFCLTVNFAGPIAPADAFGNPQLLGGFVDFDTDSNRNTGYSDGTDLYCPQTVGLGVDKTLYLFSVSGGFASLSGTLVPVVFDPTSFTAFIPVSALGDTTFEFIMVLGTGPEPTDCAPDGGRSFRMPPVDTDGDFVPDQFDNCPAVSNQNQLDSDRDGQGDVCDATPFHDLAVTYVRASSVTVRPSGAGTSTMSVQVTVQNLVNHPESASVAIEVDGLPAGCEVSLVTGDTNIAIRRLGRETATLRASITCGPGLVAKGKYPLVVTATVAHTGAGAEQIVFNNSATAGATLTIR